MVTQIAAKKPVGSKGRSSVASPPKQIFGQLCARNFVHPAAQFGHHANADLIRRDPVVQHPLTAFGDIQRLGQQVIDVQNVDPLFAHRVREDVVILLRLLDPEHVIKQQILTVFGRQATMGQTGAADDHLPQCAGLRMNAKSLVQSFSFPFNRLRGLQQC